MISHYEVLEVPRDADAAVIKSAYRRKVRAVHPDVIGEETGLFRMVQAAYDELSDPSRRAAYDAQLAGGPATSEPTSPGTDASAGPAQGGGWNYPFPQHVRDEWARREGVDAERRAKQERKQQAAMREAEQLAESRKFRYRGRAWLLVAVTFYGGWWGVHGQDWAFVQRMHEWASVHGWGPTPPMSEEITGRALSYGLMNAVLWRLGYAFRRRVVQDRWSVIAFVPLVVSVALWSLSPTLNLLVKDLTFLISMVLAVAWAFPASYRWIGRRAKRRAQDGAPGGDPSSGSPGATPE